MNRYEAFLRKRAQSMLYFWEVLFKQLLVLMQAAASETQKKHKIKARKN